MRWILTTRALTKPYFISVRIKLWNLNFSQQKKGEDVCPEELKQLVIDCTKKEPKERLSVDEVVDQITQIKDSITYSVGLVNP